MALERISHELHMFKSLFEESGEVHPVGDDAFLRRIEFTVGSLGTVAIELRFPSDYPDKPPLLQLDPHKCTSVDAVMGKLSLVCPELVDWCADSTFRFPEISDLWDPGFTVARIIAYIKARLSTPAFPEMVQSIRAGELPSADGPGTLTIFFGTAGEAPPAPSAASEFNVLIDPSWVHLGSGRETELPVGPLQWRKDAAHYIVFPVPYCFLVPEHSKALDALLGTLQENGWTSVRFVESAIHLPLPKGVPCFQQFAYTHFLKQGTSWEMVPSCLRRCSPGETPGSYGGELVIRGDGDDAEDL